MSFSCDAAPLVLHSFPTRRSSDLFYPGDNLSGAGSVDQLVSSLYTDLGRQKGYLQNELTRDRKSTRLNSSHRCISYAVFCLKKKRARRGKMATSTKPTATTHLIAQ